MNADLFRRLHPRARKWLLWSAVGFVLYTIIGFFLLPPIIKGQMTKHLPEITKRQAAVRQVKVNPWTLSLTVRGLALTEPDGRPFASWEEFYVNFQSSSLFRLAWTFKEIRVVRPVGEVILQKNGQLNFANMFEAPTNAPPKQSVASVPRVNIFHLEITNGFVAIEDQTRRSIFRTAYRPINLHLNDFTTRPESDTPYSFHAESDAGRSVTWAGDLSVQPLRSSGHLELTAVQFPRYQPYVEDFTRAVLTNGLADLQFDYRLAANTNGLSLIVTNAALQVSKVEAIDPDTGEIVVGLHALDVKQAAFNLREGAARVGAVKVSQASLLSRIKPDGHLNLLDLITLPVPPTNEPPKAAVPGGKPAITVTVDEFTVEQTAVRFEDLTLRTPFKTELKPIEVSVKAFTTKPDADATYSFRVDSEAAEAFQGAGSFSVNPPRSTGEVKINAVDVKKYLPYAEDFFRGKIIAGKVDVRVPYSVALDTNGPRATVTNLSVKLSALEVLMPETSEQVTHIKEIGFERVDASLEDRRGRVGLFKGDGGSLLVRRQKDGTINLLGLLAASRTNAPTAAPAQPEAPEGGGTNDPAIALGGWTLNVDEIQLDNYTVKIEDLVPAKPSVFLIDQLTANMKGVSNLGNTPVTAAVAFRLNETGNFNARGTAQVSPLFADFDVAVTNIDLRATQPYVEPFAALDIVSGGLSTAGKIHFQTNDATAPMLTFSGGVRVANFAIADQVMRKEFVRWDDFVVSGIDAGLMPNRVKIEEIRFTRPKASLLIGPDQRPNLSLILKPETAATNTAAVSPPSGRGATNFLADLFPIELGLFTLEQASLAFADESVQPNAALGVNDLSGTIKGLSSKSGVPAEVDFSGQVNTQSTFYVRGKANPFPEARLVDLSIASTNTPLTPLTGYMEKYAGYPLRKGRVSTSLHYRVDGTAIQAENQILLDQLTLGAHNNSPDATKLPVRLGIALLKDSNGLIDLNVPVSGKLDDPEFGLGSVIVKVVVNMIVKAAASPFKLLGALVGGGGDELSFVGFTPGSTNLVEGELDKLGKLASALEKRPALNLEIEGGVDPGSDREAIAMQKLTDSLKAKRIQELTAKGRAPESVATFQFEPGERERLLRIAFVEKFGTNVAEVIQTNLARLNATNQTAHTASAKTKKKLFQRITGMFGDGGMTPGEKQLSKADRETLGLATPELMEALLADQAQVSDDDLQPLITARARWVQDWLVQSGHVSADRLFLATPKSVDANYRGESRVNLSLN